MRIFIVEDNENIREACAVYLKLEGYEIIEFGDLKPVYKAIEKNPPDLILLDVMLPDGNGFSFAKKIKETSNIPIIFLTARAQETDRITGLELGADDYIVKPFSNKEMVLRVKAVLRRAGVKSNDSVYVLENSTLKISAEKHCVSLNSKIVQLTPAEWNILIHLSENPERVFSRLQLLEHCLDTIAEASERTIDTHIKNIRNKLAGVKWIETIRGFGYKFRGIKQ